MANPQTTFILTKFAAGSFWDRRREVVRNTTIPYQLRVLRETGRYDAFDLKWQPIYGDAPEGYPANRHLFWDSDVGKWIEGTCYFLAEQGNVPIEAAVADLIGKMERAQQKDGYLNIHYQVVQPGKRFTNLRDMHEMYNCGHLIEAAIIHSYIKDNRLLAVMERYASLLKKVFGPSRGQLRGYPGHPEIELALVRLYKATNDKSYFDLAKFFIEERGKSDPMYYDVEAKARGDRPNERPGAWPERKAYWYQQAHKPILEQDTVEGHAVRVTYLFTAAADLALLDAEFGEKYIPVLERLWNNMVGKKMYLTGGVGAMDQWEGFGINYFLPQSTDEGGCYSETCAGIGVMMWANRMLQIDLNRKYSDIMELCLYNCVLTGMSIDGKAFTYVNQLASSSGEPNQREEWFDCACCPPNMVRTMGILGGYVWDIKELADSSSDRRVGYELDFVDVAALQNPVEINVHLYSSCTLSYKLSDGSTLTLEQKTDWPWSGNVEFYLTTENQNVTIRLRIPAWAEEYKLTPGSRSADVTKGYLTLTPEYLNANPCFRISMPMVPRLIKPHIYTNQPIVAVARGPLVYCAEDVDNAWVGDHFKSLVFLPTSTASFQEIQKSDLPSGESYIAIQAPKSATMLPESLTKFDEDEPSPFYVSSYDGPKKPIGSNGEQLYDLTFIPYYARANRKGKGMMRVGLRNQV